MHKKVSPRLQRTALSKQIAGLFIGAGTLAFASSAFALDPCAILSADGGYTTVPVCGSDPSYDVSGSTVAGNGASVNTRESVAIGDHAKTKRGGAAAHGGAGQTAVGTAAVTAGAYSSAFGFQAGGEGASGANASYATMIGAFSTSYAEGGTALGDHAGISLSAVNGTALGRYAYARQGGSIALGSESTATRAAITNVIDPLTGMLVTTTRGAVSVGSDGTIKGILPTDDAFTRQITNVANGTEDTDAVNVRQVKAIRDQLQGQLGNFVAYDDASKTSVKFGGPTATSEVALTNVKAGVNPTDAVNFGQLTATNNQVMLNTTNITKNTTDISTLFADALLLDPSRSFYDAGRTGKNLTIQNLAPGVNGTDAVNVNQLKAVEAKIGSGTTLDAVLYDDATHGTVTLVGAGGSKTTPVKVTNVAAGAATTDAVNFGQLKATNDQVAQNTTNIANNTTNISKNTTDINTLFADALLLDPTKSFYDSKSLKIKNVADGDVTATSKDAVNGSQLKALQDQITAGVTGNFVAYDDATKTSVKLGGAAAAGTVALTNVKAGVNPTDAVNFGQLTATNNQVSQNTTNIANNTTNINTLFADALLLDPTRSFYDSKSLKIKNVADGDITATSKDAVNGSQLKALDDKITAVSGGNFVAYDDASKTSVTLGGVGAASTVRLGNVKEAILSATSKDAVNGSQLYATNNQVTKNSTDITTLFNTTLQFNGSYYDAGNRIIRNVARPVIGSDAVNKDYVDEKISGVNANLDNVVKYDNASKDTVTLGGANGTKVTNVADGNIAAGSKDAINGGQLKAYGDTILNSSKSYTDNKFNQISQGTTGLFQVNVGTVVNPDTSGSNSVAGGSGAVSSGANSVAIGNNAVASGQNSTALGTGAKSSGNNSVALGNGSDDGGRANVVAVGNRVISNMADGVQNSDGATVGQLRAATAEANNYTDQRVNALHGDIDKLERRSNAGIASAIALQAPANYAPGATTLRVGTGYYGKQVALGVSFRSTAENGRWSITGGVSGGRHGGVAAGAGVEWVIK
ncbi:YadA-like family protein [Imbroritus primus]|uniref:YadA-like family protein n=1 Tax=Imbroritus primus TaxID=3058603 RepID=UPI000269AA9B